VHGSSRKAETSSNWPHVWWCPASLPQWPGRDRPCVLPRSSPPRAPRTCRRSADPPSRDRALAHRSLSSAPGAGPPPSLCRRQSRVCPRCASPFFASHRLGRGAGLGRANLGPAAHATQQLECRARRSASSATGLTSPPERAPRQQPRHTVAMGRFVRCEMAIRPSREGLRQAAQIARAVANVYGDRREAARGRLASRTSDGGVGRSIRDASSRAGCAPGSTVLAHLGGSKKRLDRECLQAAWSISGSR